ncbi:MAG: hypothetical protein LWW81_13790 [Rhodocyclales bacterium]|nr:hypothetical protein [Rhodocyclales bacterium]
MSLETEDMVSALPWWLSVFLLSLLCYPIAWLCSHSAAKAWDLLPSFFALVFLLGVQPFYLRRTGLLTLGGVVALAVVGLSIALLGWLFGGNAIVFVWLAMTWGLEILVKPTAYGRMIAAQISLEKSQGISRWNTPTEQAQRMLAVGDFAVVVFWVLLLWWLSHYLPVSS